MLRFTFMTPRIHLTMQIFYSRLLSPPRQHLEKLMYAVFIEDPYQNAQREGYTKRRKP